MEQLLYILRLAGLVIAGLSVLIVIHELGHFLPARWFGMRVEKFYLFFDWPRKLFSFKKGDTEYGVGMIPLGGYVKISGIIDESMDKEHLNQPAQPWEFRSKKVWQRAIVMAGGVIMNIILGIGIFVFLVGAYGEVKTPNEKIKGIYVHKGSIGDSLGFKTGDRILTFMGEPVQYFDEISNPKVMLEDDAWYEVQRGDKKVRIDVPNGMINHLAEVQEEPLKAMVFMPLQRNEIVIAKEKDGDLARKLGLKDGDKLVALDGQKVENYNQFFLRYVQKKKKLEKEEKAVFAITLQRMEGDSSRTFVIKPKLGKEDVVGFASADTLPTEVKEYGFGGSLVRGTELAFGAIVTNIKGLGKVFSGDADVTKSLSGPVGIAKMWDSATSRNGMRGFLEMMGLISMILAFMNILPIPALDGGHLMFLAIEAITGKEPSEKVRMTAQQIGMILLLSLMAFVIVNDFLK